ncbi:MAG TPA: DUF58 domain-containing protein [Bacteroidota bacterium]|nr:DUF58 domain-containing protein [Bacteroidota bacterium]
MEDYRKYLIPDIVSKLSNMELRARLVVEGFIAGLHKSPFHGFSVEFAEHRQYLPGDETRYIDWKIYGKTEKYFIKQFEEETNLKSYLLLDISKSMDYASEKNIKKIEYASYLASSLAYLLIKQRDAVGLITYDEDIKTYIPPHATKSYLKLILKELTLIKPEKKTYTLQSLDKIAEQIKRRSLIIVFSDFLDDPNKVISTLKHFRHNNHEIIVFHILDPLEVSFAFGKDAVFIDMESNEELTTQPFHIQKAYQNEMQKFINFYKKECLMNQIDYVLLETNTPFDIALFNYLRKRSKLN